MGGELHLNLWKLIPPAGSKVIIAQHVGLGPTHKAYPEVLVTAGLRVVAAVTYLDSNAHLNC